MTVNRLTDNSGSPGTLAGNTYLDQVAEEIKALWDTGSVITLTAVAGTNTITATLAPVMSAGLTNGMNFILKPAATNTGAVTLNINSGGAVAVVDAEGTALTAGALRIGNHYLLNYDSGIAKFVVIGYTPAAVVPYGTKLLRYQDITGTFGGTAQPSFDFVNGVSGVVLDSTYDYYTLKINSCAPVTDDVEGWFRIGTGAGPTYQTANYLYMARANTTGVAGDLASNSAASIIMTRQSPTTDVGNATGETFSATINFSDPDLSKFFDCYGQCVYRTAGGNLAGSHFNGQYGVQSAITALRFQFETGNIASGSAALYGHTSS